MKTFTIKEVHGLGLCEKLKCVAYKPEKPPLPRNGHCFSTTRNDGGICSLTQAIQAILGDQNLQDQVKKRRDAEQRAK